MQFELAHRRIYVAGHAGMVGSAIVRRLGSEGCEILTPKHLDLDLRHGENRSIGGWRKLSRTPFSLRPEVGGIAANSTYATDFIADNLAMLM
jgi:GDP-L-fucose synthase